MLPTKMRRGFLLRCYLSVSRLLPLIAPKILQRRLNAGKEHPTRWVEKLGDALAPRPKGPLIWLNAVGLGEVLSLRGLIARLNEQRSDLSFLVTSSTAASAQVFTKNLPARSIHQFLPIDGPGPRKKFLDHFKPDLCIWAEQDLWPGFVSDLATQQIPQAVIAARMNDRSFQSHRRAKGLYRDLYQAMKLITAQDNNTASHLRALGAEVRVTGSLKPAAPVLACDPKELETLQTQLSGRTIWLTAPSHAADEDVALQAHDLLLNVDPTALLIIAPRFPERAAEITQERHPRRSKGEVPRENDPIWLCDTFGDLGLVYRLAQCVLIGGTFDTTEGHNPWEAAALGATVLHGPNTANFAADFALLDQAQAAITVTNATELFQALRRDDLPNIARRASSCIKTVSDSTKALAADLIALLER